MPPFSNNKEDKSVESPTKQTETISITKEQKPEITVNTNKDFTKNDTFKKLSDGLEPVLRAKAEKRTSKRKNVTEQHSRQQSLNQSSSNKSKTKTIEISFEEDQNPDNVENSGGTGTSTPKPKKETSSKPTQRKAKTRNKKQTEIPKEEKIQTSQPTETPKEEKTSSSPTVVEQKPASQTNKNLKIQESSSETTQTTESEENSFDSTQKSEEQENLSKINFGTIEMPKNENYLGSKIDEFVSKGGDENPVEGYKQILRTRIRNSTNLNFCEKEFEQQELDRINSIDALKAYAKRYACLDSACEDKIITEIEKLSEQEQEKTEKENTQQKKQNIEVNDSEIKHDEQGSDFCQ